LEGFFNSEREQEISKNTNIAIQEGINKMWFEVCMWQVFHLFTKPQNTEVAIICGNRSFTEWRWIWHL